MANQIYDTYTKGANIILFPGSAENFLETVPEKSINLIVTSPPYNIGKQYEKRKAIEKYLETQRTIISKLYRVLRDDGSICWQVGNYVNNGEIYPLDIFFYSIFKEQGLYLRDRIIWHFEHGLHASTRFSGRYEMILWFTKSNNYTFNLDSIRIPSKYPGKLHNKGPNKGKPSGNPKGKNPSNVWDIVTQDWEDKIWNIPNVKANHIEKTLHPCQFPVELVERCVLALTNEGDSVLDPYAGVGSSLIAAIKNKRRAIGCEKEITYFDISRERINSYLEGTLKLRSLGKPIHNPKMSDKVARVPDDWKDHANSIYYQSGKKK